MSPKWRNLRNGKRIIVVFQIINFPCWKIGSLPANRLSELPIDAISELVWSSYRTGNVDVWRGLAHTHKEDTVAEEVPVVLVYNTHPHVVMLATPLNLEDFALDFSLTEGIISDQNELLSIRVVQRAKGIEVRMSIPESKAERILSTRRNMTGRT